MCLPKKRKVILAAVGAVVAVFAAFSIVGAAIVNKAFGSLYNE